MIYLSYRQLTIEKNTAPRFKYPKENDRLSNHSWSGYDAWAQIKSMWYGHGKLFCMDTLPNLLALQSTLMSSSTILDENVSKRFTIFPFRFHHINQMWGFWSQYVSQTLQLHICTKKHIVSIWNSWDVLFKYRDTKFHPQNSHEKSST